MGTIINYIHWNCDPGLKPLLRSKKVREIVDKNSWQDIIIDPSERKVFDVGLVDVDKQKKRGKRK